MTCSAPKRLLVVAEREPDDMFRSQTDVSDWREVQRVLNAPCYTSRTEAFLASVPVRGDHASPEGHYWRRKRHSS